MRHGKKVKKLGRTHAHRKATLAALSTALITHKRITTTLAKAKALRGYVEPVLHRAHDDSTHSRRQAFRRLGDKEAVKALFGEIAETMSDRPGGYTRVIKLGQRAGDAAEMAVIEIVDFNDVKPEGAAAAKRKTRRSRRRSSGDAAATPAAPKAAAKPDAPKKAAGTGDDFTKLYGVGDVFAGALQEAGIRTYAQLAKADLYALRDVIQEHTAVSDESANEETWAAQAAFAAAGDWDGHAAYVEEIKAGTASEATTEGPADVHPATEEAAAEEPAADEAAPAPEDQAAEAVASDAENPAETGNPQVPLSPGVAEHGDAEQGAAPGTGEPPPEADATTRGRSEHRG